MYILFGLVFFFSAAAFRFVNEIASQPVFTYVSVLVIAAPSIFFLYRWLSAMRATAVLVVLSLFAYAIEYVGLVTGFPYGYFSYGQLMGVQVFGSLPVLLPFAYVPLVFAAAVLAARFAQELWVRVVVCTGFLVLFDLVLDPGAVAIGLWSFLAGGWYYGVPLTNFVGWLFSGVLASALFFVLVNKWFVPHELASSAFLMLSFWVGVAFFYALWVPFVLGVILLVLLYRAQ